MGMLDQVLGSVLGSQARGGSSSSPLMMALTALLASGSGGAGGLGGLLGGATGAPAGSAGGLGSLLESFIRSGHGDVAHSWVGLGENRPIQPDQLGDVLGPETVSELSQQTGLQRPDLLSGLAQYLPEIVDRLTPHGRMPDNSDFSR